MDFVFHALHFIGSVPVVNMAASVACLVPAVYFLGQFWFGE